jgi:DHA3 family macrolide efflux protein-like MFS transporter
VVIGITNAFQQPASAVAAGRLVPKEKISNVSGMNSFSSNQIVVFSPMLAAFLFAAGGLPLILPGGIIVSVKKESRHKAAAIYVSAALSFLFGDMMMAVGKNVFWWSAAAVAASLPIPFIQASQNAILYRRISAAMQGRVFAVRNAIQYSTIPVGIILGGWLADYVFEPFMAAGNGLAGILGAIVGNSAGSGMAAMFLCTGICGFAVSMASCFNGEIKKLN